MKRENDMKTYTRVYAPIDLDAVVYNMESMKKNISPDTGMIGVVKTDGYGHGAVPVAQAVDPYVAGYAVATIDEALNLRRHGVVKPVLILGVTHVSRYEELLEHDIRPAVFTMEQAKPLSDLAVRAGRTANIHLALDTGMSRIGMTPDEQGADLAAGIAGLPGIRAEGLFTHFARADETDKKEAQAQLSRYLHFVELLKERGVDIPVKHCSNSAGIIDLPSANLDLVRAGISIYGLYPSDEVDKNRVPLKPAMGLKSFVTYVKTLEPGQAVSYGGTFVAERSMRVATIPVGYGDGYPRNLSGKGHVLIHGKRAAILGRVCMDQFMVDVTDIPDVDVDTEVTLIGTDGKDQIRVEELSDLCGRFHYELVCDIGKRVPRVYIRHGEVVGTKDYFDDPYPGFGLD
ncbi:alanine racemase [Clostridium sp. AN503]|uniref:alanine racemase n=1 Tax=Clostridium sp. AN503 TaxID=3160598 RepID=UPI003459A397